MKEQLQEKLVEIVTQIKGAVGKASDFAMEQIPDIAYQYMKFKLVWYIVEIGLAVGMIFTAIWLFRYSKTRFFAGREDHRDMEGFGMTVSVFVGLFSFFSLVFSMYSLLMITIAPKIWLIKALAEMIGGGK